MTPMQLKQRSMASENRRKSAQALIGMALVTGLLAGFQIVSPINNERASAAGLSCGGIALSEAAKNFIHGCSGKGTVQYTLSCYGGNTVRSYGWNTGGQNRVFSAVCSNKAIAWKVTYSIIK